MIVRKAHRADLDPIGALMVASMRGLGPGHYSPDQVESICRFVCVPEVALIDDGTYFVIEDDGRLVACGGWSRRRKAFAGPADVPGDDQPLDPATEPARVRAMFTHPDAARRGLGAAVLNAAEAAARDAGFVRMQLGATMSGLSFYRRRGYIEVGREDAELPDGVRIGVVRMEKPL